MDVEARINGLFENTSKGLVKDSNVIFDGLEPKQKELLYNIVNELKERLSDDKDESAYNSTLYLYHYLQAMESSKELKYILAYVSKSMGYTKPYEFVYDENEQFIFESIMFSAMTLYNNGGSSRVRLAESHKRFVQNIEQKKRENK